MTDLGETPSDGFKIGIAVWGWLELLKTYDGKFCLKFFSSTAVRSDSCQVWQRSGLTAVELDSCQRTPAVYMNFNSLVRHDFLQLNSLTSFFHFLVRKSLPKPIP